MNTARPMVCFSARSPSNCVLLVAVFTALLLGEASGFPPGGPTRPTSGDSTPHWFEEACFRSDAEGPPLNEDSCTGPTCPTPPDDEPPDDQPTGGEHPGGNNPFLDPNNHPSMGVMAPTLPTPSVATGSAQFEIVNNSGWPMLGRTDAASPVGGWITDPVVVDTGELIFEARDVRWQHDKTAKGLRRIYRHQTVNPGGTGVDFGRFFHTNLRVRSPVNWMSAGPASRRS